MQRPKVLPVTFSRAHLAPGLVPFPGHSINNAAGINQASVGTTPMTKDSTSVTEVTRQISSYMSYKLDHLKSLSFHIGAARTLHRRLFHKIFGVAFFLLLCCAQGKPAGIPPLPGFVRLPEYDEGFIPGFLPLVDSEVGDMIRQLEHQISRLAGVLSLEKKITASGGKIFATNGEKADFQTTLKKCREVGGSIATPRNPGENDAILYFVKNFNTYAYLGIKESLIPSNFQFLDGTQLSYANWHLNEPSGKGKEECVEMYTDGTWNDKKCNQNRLIVCQF